MKGIFVTGTDTGVGKTVSSAALSLRASQLFPSVNYLKAIQTFIEQEDDAATVASLTKGAMNLSCSTGLSFKRPLSPHLAALKRDVEIDFPALVELCRQKCQSYLFIIEGSCGLLVPINRRHTMLDLIKALALPVVITSRTTLGCINHSLLTIDCLRQNHIEPLGV